MSSDQIAIRVKGLSKCYQIYDRPEDRLKQSIVPRLQRIFSLQTTQYFREFWALKEISFEVNKGETIGVIGRNGCGKSTLLQIICGTLTPTSGTVETYGRVAALLELGSGFNLEFTGRENVYMNAAVLGLSTRDIDARFDDISAFADIGQFIEQPVKTYSSGMMLRLAFAVIAHVDADILVIDEALAVGDAFFTQKCMRFLRNFMKTGTVLFVSHDTGAVINLCNRAILLSEGHIIETGTPKEVAEKYLVALYKMEQEVNGILVNETTKSPGQNEHQHQYHDVRKALIDSSTLRNDIEIFKFEFDQSGFGTGYAQIISVQILDKDGSPIVSVIGGEDVILEIRCFANKDILRPIVGFQFKDRLGQVIFADNTFITYQFNPQAIARGEELIARFDFRLPLLPTGDYSITAAIADNTQDSNIQHHWIHDSLIIRVHSSSVCFGLVGVPMRNISLGIN